MQLTVLTSSDQMLNRFSPMRAFGAGVDGHSEGETAKQLSSDNITAMLSAGLKPLTYRLRTELANEAWHWNPRGSWSDGKHQQGYWTSSTRLAAPIKVSYGYRLPRRGNTFDQANNDGYSRIDDGNRQTFWKSNPYLDEHYTHDRSLPPQWIAVDLGTEKPVNAVRIAWAQPFARTYQVEYGVAPEGDDLSNALPAEWHAFTQGTVEQRSAGTHTVKLSSTPINVRFVRILLKNSSHTSNAASRDIRDRLGFAVRELYLGLADDRGQFIDAIAHGTHADAQSRIYVSSTDPWHRAIDRDPDTEQPGLDFIFRSSLTHALPVLTPVGVLYDTPANAAAELKYLAARHYSVDQVELGEEPDGQLTSPEHYGALYRLFYEQLHAQHRQIQFGGPSMQDIEPSPISGDTSLSKAEWVARFRRYLEQHHALDAFSFFSFEWYPFGDDCNTAKQLVDAPQILTTQLQALERAGLTHDIPWIISEYGYSAYGTRSELDIDGALLNIDSVARFLALGGQAAYLYGYEPGDALNEQDCSAGNNMLFFRDSLGAITQPTATYWAARLMTQEWAQPIDASHELYSVTFDSNAPVPELSAYALRRPDNTWALLLLNKDSRQSFNVTLRFEQADGSFSSFAGRAKMIQYSHSQYELNDDKFHPTPVKAAAPERSTPAGSASIVLPPSSISVVRGSLTNVTE